MNPLKNALPIWHPDGLGKNEVFEFKSHFAVVEPELCHIDLHAETTYALYINESLVSVFAFPDYEGEWTYDSIPLDEYVERGTNTLRLMVYYQGEDSFSVRDHAPCVLFSVMEGEDELLVSDAGVPVRRCSSYLSDVPKLTPQLSYSFAYDATVPLPPYMPAAAVPVSGTLKPRPVSRLSLDAPVTSSLVLSGQAIARSDQRAADNDPASVMQHAYRALERPDPVPQFPSAEGVRRNGNDFIVDLGQEYAGLLYLDIELDEPGELLLGWGEHLDDGHVRTLIGLRHFAAKLRFPQGRSVYVYPFKRAACRYLELMLSANACTLHYLGLIPTRYPIEKMYEVQLHDRLHETIFHTSLRTLLLCMHEHYEDCPWREQALYTMDSRTQMLAGYYAFEEYTFAKASLELIAKSLREDHYLELISPGKASITIPAFTAIFPIQVEEYLRYSDDLSFVRRLLPICREIIDGFIAGIDANGLIPTPREPAYWNFYEWQTGLDGHSVTNSLYDAPLNAMAALSLRALAKIESSLGDPIRARSLHETLSAMQQAYHQAFFDEEKQYYCSFVAEQGRFHHCELTQALSLLCGFVPEAQKAAVRQALATAHLHDPDFYPITLSHSIFKYEALLQDPEHYASLVFRTVAEDYGFMLRRGATSFWETVEGADAFGKAGSLCHGWSAVPAYLYLKYIVDTKHEKTALPSEWTGIYAPSAELRLAQTDGILLT